MEQHRGPLRWSGPPKKADELMRRIQEQRERDMDDLCALLHITREELEAGMKGGGSP